MDIELKYGEFKLPRTGRKKFKAILIFSQQHLETMKGDVINTASIHFTKI